MPSMQVAPSAVGALAVSPASGKAASQRQRSSWRRTRLPHLGSEAVPGAFQPFHCPIAASQVLSRLKAGFQKGGLRVLNPALLLD